MILSFRTFQQTLTEGGHIFKDASGQPRTQRIAQADIAPTVAWLESITKLDLTGPASPYDQGPAHWFGSTGRKADSGDLDLQVDSTAITKEQLVDRLTAWVKTQPDTGITYIRKAGVSVHFLTPIRGNPTHGYVQTDFMFTPHPAWSQFIFANAGSSQFKGADRFHALNSLASHFGWKISQTEGVLHRDGNALVSADPTVVVRKLLGPAATIQSAMSVEGILSALKTDPDRQAKLTKFEQYLTTEPRVDRRDQKLDILHRALAH